MADLKGLYHVTVVGRLHGQTTQNGFFFRTRGTDAPDTYAQELIELINDFNTTIVPIICLWADQEWECNALIGTTLYPWQGPMFELGPLGLNGAQTGGSLPSFNAGVVAYRTAVNSSNFRGRSYFAGVSKSFADGGRVTGANLTQLQDIGNGLLARYGGGVSSTRPVWGVFSPTVGRRRVTAPIVHYEFDSDVGFVPIIQVTARPTIYTCGHRRLNRGI
jgi:hypothetical protein